MRPWGVPVVCLVAAVMAYGSAALSAETTPDPATELLRGARMWTAKNRADIAKQMLEKLLVMQPNTPEALAMLADLALREGKIDDAYRFQETLRTKYPSHPATRELAVLARVYGPEREKLANMRLLARAGRKAEAADLARALFPEGPPLLGGLGLEYHQILGSSPQGGPEALRQLDRLYRQTGETRYRLAYVDAQMGQGASPTTIVTEIEALIRQPDANVQVARDIWRRALDRLDNQSIHLPRFQTFLKWYPGDVAMTERITTVQQARGGSAVAQSSVPTGTVGIAGTPNVVIQIRSDVTRRAEREAQAIAHFQGLLKQGNTALEQNDLPNAAELTEKALVLQPQNADALVTLAQIRTLQGSLLAASQALYEKALEHSPGNKTALVGLSQIFTQQGQFTQALELLHKAIATNPALASTLASAQTDVLSAQADQYIEAKEFPAAQKALESAIHIDPEDPWLCHRLARLHLRLQEKVQALAVMDAGIGRMPKNGDMRYARALIRMAVDDDAGALEDMNQIAVADLTVGMKALARRAEIGKLVVQALQPSNAEQVPALLELAQNRAGKDPDLLQSVANAWGKLGKPEQGLAIFQRLVAQLSPLPFDVELDYAQWMNRARSDVALVQYLPELFAKPGLMPAQEAKLLGLYADVYERQIEAMQKSGDAQGAKKLAQSTQSALPKTQIATHRARVRSRLLLAANEYADATVQLVQALKEQPDDVDARLDMGTALARQGRMPEAIEHAQGVRKRIPETDVNGQLSLLRLWQRTNDTAQARALADQLLQRFPSDSDVVLHAARLERADGNYAQAVDFFRQAQRLTPKDAKTSDGKELATAPIQREIDSIDTRLQSWVEAGQKTLQKDSAPGVSSLHGIERSLVAWMPRSYDGRYFLHVDQLELNAGKLPRNRADVLDFGQVAAWPSSAYPTDGAVQRGGGTNIGFGYVNDGYQWDMGVIGLGLPVTNWVGGLGKNGSWGSYSYKLELARRPMTGSMLSYAGARDPITGKIWGGMVSTGLSGRVSTDIGPYSTSFTASQALLTGQNVQDNTRWQLRWAADRDVLRASGNVVNVGLSLSFQGHARDLSEFTWGNGGYYSPKNYVALAMPIEWSGRSGPWAWLARGSLSVSRSSSPASPYFPNSPVLQEQAHGLNRLPIYTGSSGVGFGGSLRGAVEYQYSDQLALGAQVEMERSAYYSPTSVLLYARYLLAPVRIPVLEKLRPAQGYASF